MLLRYQLLLNLEDFFSISLWIFRELNWLIKQLQENRLYFFDAKKLLLLLIIVHAWFLLFFLIVKMLKTGFAWFSFDNFFIAIIVLEFLLIHMIKIWQLETFQKHLKLPLKLVSISQCQNFNFEKLIDRLEISLLLYQTLHIL